jgi:Rod binding domain-containing protein
MRRTIPEGGLFAKGFAGELYEEMLWDEWAKTLASTGALGMSEMILSQLRG